MNKTEINVIDTRDILEGELSKALKDSLKLDPSNLLEARDILMGIRGNLESIIRHISLEITYITRIHAIGDMMTDEEE